MKKIVLLAVVLSACQKAGTHQGNEIIESSPQKGFEHVIVSFQKQSGVITGRTPQSTDRKERDLYEQREEQLLPHLPNLRFENWSGRIENLTASSSHVYFTLDMSSKGGDYSFLCKARNNSENLNIKKYFSTGNNVSVSGELTTIYASNDTHAEKMKSPKFHCNIQSISLTNDEVFQFISR